jgi:hypothetical protein
MKEEIGVVVHSGNLSTEEAKTGGYQAQHQPELQRETLSQSLKKVKVNNILNVLM